jgi:hypothetical protein
MTRTDRSLLLTAGGMLLVLCVLGWLLAPPSEAEEPTSYSAGAGGTKAAYLLLQSLGYDVSRWEQSPADLDRAAQTTVIFTNPMAPSPDERRAIAAFIESGGRVIVTGKTGGEFMGVGVHSGGVDAIAGTRADAAQLTPITAAARHIELEPEAAALEETGSVPLYVANRRTVVVHIRKRRGDLFWWASPTPLTNAGINKAENLAFVLASLGPMTGRRVLYDEYFHGYRPSMVQTMMRTPVKWVAAQGVLIGLVVLATYSRRSGPIMAAVTDVRLSSLEFVRTLGTLYRRARGAAIPVDVAYAGFRSALRERHGIGVSVEAATAAALVAQHRAVDAAALATLMRACEAARERTDLRSAEALRLVQQLHDRSMELGLYGTGRET